ncbi:MAG: hypothetical protein IKD08_01980 [Alphaproteobacteria bacterium]|nr:hypothetical protein [Alphaproteobacteria bacterium]
MIAATSGGNDLKAAKVASLLGVSAGIYSAQDSSKAWGIKGVWAENIANYGFTSLPTGITVLTTAYKEETTGGINEEQLKEIIESTSYDTLTTKKFCLDNPNIPEDERCVEDWDLAVINPVEIIDGCNSGTQSACQKGWEKNINRSCEQISQRYKKIGFAATSGIYKITTGATTQVEKACYFVNGDLPTNAQLIEAAKSNDIARRYDWENNKITASCTSIITNWNSAPSGLYTHVSGTSTYSGSQPCLFVGSRLANNNETITQCNSGGGSSVACRYGWKFDVNRSCARVIATWTSAPTGWYQITTSSSSSSAPCVFTGNRVATAAEVVAQCNWSTTSSAMASSVQCRYGYLKGYNTSCTNVINNYAAGKGIENSIVSASGGWRECCDCCKTCANIGTVSGGECKNVNGCAWVRSTSTKNYWDSQTFCSNLGMELKSKSQLQAAGLWNIGSNPFSVPRWHWTTDVWSGNSSWGAHVWLGNSSVSHCPRSNAGWYEGYQINIYALCGLK